MPPPHRNQQNQPYKAGQGGAEQNRQQDAPMQGGQCMAGE
jgi:hypothetical protein